MVSRVWLRAALCVALCTNVANAGLLDPVRRADASTTTPEVATTTEQTTSAQPTQTDSEASTTKDAESSSVISSASVTVDSSTSRTVVATTAPSALNGNIVSNTSSIYSNCRFYFFPHGPCSSP